MATKSSEPVQDVVKAYLELAFGLTEASKKKAEKTVRKAAKELLGKSGATASQLQAMAEDLVSTGLANREAVTRIVRLELDRALGRVGLATAEEVATLTARIEDLERELHEAHAAAAAAPAAATPAPAAEAAPAEAKPAAKAVAKKTVAKKAVAKATPAKPVASATPAEGATPTESAVAAVAAVEAPAASAAPKGADDVPVAAKRAPAKKGAAKSEPARPEPAKAAPAKAAATKAVAKKAPAKKAAAGKAGS